MIDTTKIKRSMSAAIPNADFIHWIAGALDLSLNDDTQKKLGIAWQPQFFELANVTNREEVSKALRNAYSPTKYVPRPVQMKECDGSARAISYAFKTDFVKRIAYRTEVGPPREPPKVLDHAQGFTATHRACQGDAVDAPNRLRRAIVPARSSHDTRGSQRRLGQN
jgi:hypothetical protein